jgi:hypothetical protein
VTCAANQCAGSSVANSDKSATGSIAGVTGDEVEVACDPGYSEYSAASWNQNCGKLAEIVGQLRPYCSRFKILLVFAACANEHISVEWAGGIHATGHASFGAQSADPNSYIDLEVVHTEPADGCSGITNGDALVGKLALIQRGTCNFVEQVLNAQNVGAAAVIVYNDRDGDALMPMSGADDGHNILSVSISENDGIALAAAIAGSTTSVSLSCQGCAAGTNAIPFRSYF